MVYVLDASAIIAYLRRESGGSIVKQILGDNGNQAYAHSINLAEVYYDFWRRDGELTAQQIIRELAALNVRTRSDLEVDFWQSAARLKAVHRRVSLADCFAIALAQSLNGTVLTCDHHEFDAIAAAKICDVTFIR